MGGNPRDTRAQTDSSPIDLPCSANIFNRIASSVSMIRNGGTLIALKVFLDSLGLAVEVVDVVLLAGDQPPLFLPLQQLVGRLGLEQADRASSRRGVLKRRDAGPARAGPGSRPGRNTTVPGSTSFQFRVKV